MTTMEIAELTRKRHDHVMRDTRVMLSELYGKKSLPNFGEWYQAENKQYYECYRLPKKEILVLISGYSVKLRMAIITKLEELEGKIKIIDLNDPVVLRSALLNFSEKVIELEETVKEQEPKVAALNRIATSEGSLHITAAAKHLQVRPQVLFKYLSENKWIYKRTGSKTWYAYQVRQQQNLMEHKVTTLKTTCGNGDVVESIHEQARITSKGLAKLAETFGPTLLGDVA